MSDYGVEAPDHIPERERVGNSTPTPLSPGTTLAACEALTGGQELFTRDQVAYYSALAYRSGAAAAHRDDIAELTMTWERNPTPRESYETRVAQRLAQMTETAVPFADAPDDDWPEVTAPGTGDLSTLVSVYPCPDGCDRWHQNPEPMPDKETQDGPGGAPGSDEYIAEWVKTREWLTGTQWTTVAKNLSVGTQRAVEWAIRKKRQSA